MSSPDPSLDSAVAVIGMACRFPGAPNKEAFWHNLSNGIASITTLSDETLREQGVRPESISDPRYVKAAAVLDDFDRFDARLFGYSPREARWMDPQQRIFLETAFEAMEDAGYGNFDEPQRVGVFAGSGGLVSSYLLAHLSAASEIVGTTGSMAHLAVDKDYLATKVSYQLNLTGPSINVQTACSTSLVALHLACQSVMLGECDMALAGAVAIRVPHLVGYRYEEGGIWSPDGRCRAFDERASGTVFGSGSGAVVVKRAADALADGDHIAAIVRGTAVNNDGGGKVSYTASGLRGQSAAIEEALAIAEVAGGTIGYVEAHGTATAMGDPIEVASLVRGFGAPSARTLCGLGSVKSNIGHLESAAGIAGLIKVVLMLQHRMLVPTLHVECPNPRLRLEESPFYLTREKTEWQSSAGPLRAGINSLGLGGTNAFAVVEEYPTRPSSLPDDDSAMVLKVSAQTEGALRQLAQAYAVALYNGQERAADICAVANCGRADRELRWAVVGRSRHALATALKSALSTRSVSRPTGSKPEVAFAATGQGAQYLQMGFGLRSSYADYRAKLDECDDIVRPLLNRSLIEVLREDPKRLERTEFAQPALFAVAVSLAAQWASWGVEPSLVLGHSLGDYVSAHLAGVMSLEDSLRLVVARAQLMEQTEAGMMVTVFGKENLVREHLRHGGWNTIQIAAVNHAHQVVISGATAEVKDALQSMGEYRHQYLSRSFAFHSPLMRPVADKLAAVADGVEYSPARRAWISSMDGHLHEVGSGPLSSNYWAQQLLSEVRWDCVLRTLATQSLNAIVEIGPQPVLCTLAKTSAEYRQMSKASWLASLRKKKDAAQCMLTSAASLYERGVDIAWPKVHGAVVGPKVKVPTYTFDRQRYWLDAPRTLQTVDSPSSTKNRTEPGLIRRVEWQKWTRTANEGNDAHLGFDGVWLVAGPERVAQQLVQEHGGRGATFIRLDVERNSAESVELLQRWSRDKRFRGVLFYWGESARNADEVMMACKRLAKVVDDLNGLAVTTCTTRVFTRGCQVTAGAGSAPGFEANSFFNNMAFQSALWGLGRVIGQEHPQIRLKLVDLEPACTEVFPSAVFASDESQVAIRGGHAFVPRLVSDAELNTSAPPPIRTQGCYVVTGGLGALGLRASQWLADHGAGRIVLVTRRPVDAVEDKSTLNARRAALAAIERSGAEVSVLSIDLRCGDAVARLNAELPPVINGVIHAAGVLERVGSDAVEMGQFRDAWGPKISPLSGLFNAVGPETDFIVFFSSAASVWGGKELGCYAAANAALDEVAHRMNSRSYRVISISWGPWDAGGVDAGDDKSWLMRMGVGSLSPERALSAMGAALSTDCAHVVIADVDWRRFRSVYEFDMRSGLMSQTETGPTSDETADAVPASAVLKEQWRSSPAPIRSRVLQQRLRTLLGDILGVDGAEIGGEEGLWSLGLDSLLTVELAEKLSSEVGETVRPYVLLEAANVTAMTRVLEKVMGADTVPNDEIEASSRDELSVKNGSIAADGPTEARLVQLLDTLETEGL